MNKFIIVLSVLLLAACSSAPTRFYRLEAKAPETVPVSTSALVSVTTVTIPRLLDRDQIVRGTGSEQVEFGSTDHWAAPLDALIQQGLTQDLALRLPTGNVIPAATATGRPVLTIAVDVLQFEGDTTGMVKLDAFWSASIDPTKPLASHHEYIELAGRNPTYAGLADGMSDALGVLADRIAAQLP